MIVIKKVIHKRQSINLSIAKIIIETNLLDKIIYKQNVKLYPKDINIQNLMFEKFRKNAVWHYK